MFYCGGVFVFVFLGWFFIEFVFVGFGKYIGFFVGMFEMV